jgi:hypothetical protein
MEAYRYTSCGSRALSPVNQCVGFPAPGKLNPLVNSRAIIGRRLQASREASMPVTDALNEAEAAPGR